MPGSPTAPSAPALDPDLDPSSAGAARFPSDGKPKSTASDPDGPWELMAPADQAIVDRIFVNFGKAIEAYERTLVSSDAPFDRYVAGDLAAISAAAKRGLKVFIGKGNCIACHTGPMLSDSEFHDTGLAQIGDKVPPSDDGRAHAIDVLLANPFNSSSAYSDARATGKLDELAVAAADHGAFRTPGLRQIAETAPYMHTGHLATLEDVVEFYNKGGDDSGFEGTKDKRILKLNLTTQEKTDLVAFMQTLTGAPVDPALLADTSTR